MNELIINGRVFDTAVWNKIFYNRYTDMYFLKMGNNTKTLRKATVKRIDLDSMRKENVFNGTVYYFDI